MQKIKDMFGFYSLWLFTAIITLMLGFGMLGTSYSWWGFGMSIQGLIILGINVFTVLLFEKIFLKLFIGLGGLAICLTLTLIGVRGSEGLGILGIVFVFIALWIIFIPLFLIEHFRHKKSSVIILVIILILELVVVIFIVPGAVSKRYQTKKRFELLRDIENGRYSVAEAINKCDQMNQNNRWALNSCYLIIAQREKNIKLCENAIDVPGQGDKNFFIAGCIEAIARKTQNSFLCFDKRIADGLKRDLCLFDAGAIKTSDDCLKLTFPYQRQRCEAGARRSY